MKKDFLEFLLYRIITLSFVYVIIYYFLKKISKNPKNILPLNFIQRVKLPLLLLIIAIGLHFLSDYKQLIEPYQDILSHIGTLLFIFSFTWFLIQLTRILKNGLIRKYDMSIADNLNARRIHTQFNILERVIIFVILVLAIGLALMSFNNIRTLGVSLLTSAGIAGIIIGFSAQKALGTLLAGIQIAITQPIRLEDVVIVEGEWGWIEEINLTYVVLRIWDLRRLVVPTTYFIEKPFQNWTRKNANIMGTVFLYTDFMLPLESVRKELTRLLKNTDLWDGKVNVLQVTNCSPKGMEIRALISSKDSPTNWDLRVLIREKLISFIQENYPDSLPKNRIEINDDNLGSFSKRTNQTET